MTDLELVKKQKSEAEVEVFKLRKKVKSQADLDARNRFLADQVAKYKAKLAEVSGEADRREAELIEIIDYFLASEFGEGAIGECEPLRKLLAARILDKGLLDKADLGSLMEVYSATDREAVTDND